MLKLQKVLFAVLLMLLVSNVFAEETKTPSPYDGMCFNDLYEKIKTIYNSLPDGTNIINNVQQDVSYTISGKNGYTLIVKYVTTSTNNDRDYHGSKEITHADGTIEIPLDRIENNITYYEDYKYTTETYKLVMRVKNSRQAIVYDADIETEAQGFDTNQGTYYDLPVERNHWHNSEIMIAMPVFCNEKTIAVVQDIFEHMIEIANGTISDPLPATTSVPPPAPEKPESLFKIVADLADLVSAKADSPESKCKVQGVRETTLLISIDTKSGNAVTTTEYEIPLVKLNADAMTTSTTAQQHYLLSLHSNDGKQITSTQPAANKKEQCDHVDITFADKDSTDTASALIKKAIQAVSSTK